MRGWESCSHGVMGRRLGLAHAYAANCGFVRGFQREPQGGYGSGGGRSEACHQGLSLKP